MSRPTLEDPIDAVDDSDSPIRVVKRRELSDGRYNFRVAHVFIFNSKHELLLGQLGSERTNDPGTWGSSVAAHVLAGESYEQAARRRMREELALDTDVKFVDKVPMHEDGVIKFIGLFESQADYVKNQEPEHIAGLKWRSLGSIEDELARRPEKFTQTFALLFGRYRELHRVA